VTSDAYIDDPRSLNQVMKLETAPPPYATQMVEQIEIACATPLKDLSVDQVRLLIGQQIGLEFIMPRALYELSKNPLVYASYYQGDLLNACLSVDREFWMQHEGHWYELDTIFKAFRETMKDIENQSLSFYSFPEIWEKIRGESSLH
jgi:hypothetical protein